MFFFHRCKRCTKKNKMSFDIFMAALVHFNDISKTCKFAAHSLLVYIACAKFQSAGEGLSVLKLFL